MAKTFVFQKETSTDTSIQINLTSALKPGETFVGVNIGSVTPTSINPVVPTLQTAPDESDAVVLLQGGSTGIDYGIEFLVTTNIGQTTVLAAIRVDSAANELNPYSRPMSSPEVYQDLVGSIDVGGSALGTGVFAFGPETDPTGGYVTWDLLAEDGRIYASGNAYEYKVKSTGYSNTVLAQSIINIPSNVPPTLEGTGYQLRYTLSLGDKTPTGTTAEIHKYYTFENITITGLTTVPLGTQPVVEIKGIVAQVSIVTEQLFDNMVLDIYHQNTLIGSSPIATPGQPVDKGPTKTSSGWMYQAAIQTDQMQAQLPAYTLIWKYWNTNFPAMVYTEQADMWVITPSISSAISDVKAKINKARTTLYGSPDLLFPASVILTWLRRGMDAFNGYKGKWTNFNMTNAQGPIREMWLSYAELFALEAQYLAEGEKAFDFQGQAISLTVDQTQYLDNMAGKLQSRLDQEMDPFKTNLLIKGNTSGSGDVDPGKLQRGAMGTVGITISPASVYNAYQTIYPTAFNIGLIGTV